MRDTVSLGSALRTLLRRRSTLPGVCAVALLLAGLTDAARADEKLRADCDADSHFRVLTPSRLPAVAQAIWLDAQRLRWPQAPEAARIVLLHSNTALTLGADARPPDGVDTIDLVGVSNAIPIEQYARFRWFGGGPEFVLPPLIDLAPLLQGDLVIAALDADGRTQAHTRLQHAAALDARYRAALDVPLGAQPDADAVRFALWAPTAQQVAVCVHADDRSEALSARALERDATSGVWSARLPDAQLGSYYTYLVDVFVPGLGQVRNRVTDPYALGLGADGRRAMVVDLDDARFKPAGWDTHPRPPAPAHNVDMVLYELHVRDFSRDDTSVPPQHRGRYLGFAQNDSLGVRHLRALAEAGLSDVHLLPVYDISTIPETGCVTPVVTGAADSEQQQSMIAAVKHRDCYNWGYDPQHFTVPEGSYASEARDGAVRIREFRRMVMALHELGLRVGLDVVYNHTSHAGQHEKSVLDRIVPGYYHRLDAKGAIERSTCCENTATEHAMMARLMIDSAVVWARDYRIDGFRFDLMGHQPKAAMLALMDAVDAAAGKRIPIIGEGWNFGEVADGLRFEQASQLSLAGSGIATFSDRARDALRGGGAATAGAELRTAYGWLNSWDSGFGIRDSNPADQRQTPEQRSPSLQAPLPLRERGWGEGTGSPQSIGMQASDPESRIPNPAQAALAKVGLAGTLHDYRMRGSDGVERPLRAFDYAGQPAGYVSSPNEVVNYVENHDNQTLYDINALRLPQDTSADERARVQVLGMAFNLLSQGVPYFHAGIEVLRSKSLDRNSYDSGDHFNRLDYSGVDNGFGRGLPPAWDNQNDWPLMRELLADPALRPSVEVVDYTRRAFLDWLRLRAQTPLLRLSTAEDVQTRLRFLPTAPESGLIVAMIDGSGYADSPHAAVLYALNVSPGVRTLALGSEHAELARADWQLHPVLAEGVDVRAREAVIHAEGTEAAGTLVIPGRTAVVWVRAR